MAIFINETTRIIVQGFTGKIGSKTSEKAAMLRDLGEIISKQEQQSRNAQDIAKRGADLYDKIVGFVGDMNDLGNRLKQATDSYDKAFNKLSKGRGNVMRQAEMLKDLGARPTKQLNVEQLDDAENFEN